MRTNPGPATVTFIECYHYLRYMEDKYATVIEVHFSLNEDVEAPTVLCITSVTPCWNNCKRSSFGFRSVELAPEKLSRLPKILLGMLMDYQEDIDGQKQFCAQCAVADYLK